MNRRLLISAALISTFPSITRATGNSKCVHDHQCGDGYECVDGACVPRTVPCEHDGYCTEDCRCINNVCARPVATVNPVTNITTVVYVPITVTTPAGTTKRKRRRRRRK